MQYYITFDCVNILNDKLPAQVLATCADTKKVVLSSYFQRYNETIYYETMDDAFRSCVEFIDIIDKFYYEEETGAIFKVINNIEIYKTSFKIRGLI